MWTYPLFPIVLTFEKQVANRAVPLENEQTPLQNRAVKRVANQDQHCQSNSSIFFLESIHYGKEEKEAKEECY